jgi:hypothetical protein
MNTAKAIEFCNLALTGFGEKTIASFTERTTRANVCALQYERVVSGLLSEHRWEFATIQAQLSQVADVTPLIDWTYAYDLPTDPVYIRLVRMARSADSLAWPRYGNVPFAIRTASDGQSQRMYTSYAEVYVEYVGRVDEIVFPPHFVNALVVALKMELGQALTDKTDVVTEARIQLRGNRPAGVTGLLQIAKTIDSKNSPNAGIRQDAGLITGRFI